MKRHEDAELLLHRAREIRRKSLGEDDPETIVSIGVLCQHYKKRGDHATAERYRAEYQERRERLEQLWASDRQAV